MVAAAIWSQASAYFACFAGSFAIASRSARSSSTFVWNCFGSARNSRRPLSALRAFSTERMRARVIRNRSALPRMYSAITPRSCER